MLDNMLGMQKTLIVVYKDELLMNQLKKLIETKDDDDSENIVGTKDNSINIVSWTEEFWLEQKKSGNINEKVLYLGKVKGTAALIPTLDIKFNAFGASFGISGNQAVLFADSKAISNENEYNEFLVKLSELPVPDIIKRTPSSVDEISNLKYVEMHDKGIFSVAKCFIKDTLKETKDRVTIKANEFFREKSFVERQMLFYGLITLYNDYLEEYMNL